MSPEQNRAERRGIATQHKRGHTQGQGGMKGPRRTEGGWMGEEARASERAREGGREGTEKKDEKGRRRGGREGDNRKLNNCNNRYLKKH